MIENLVVGVIAVVLFYFYGWGSVIGFISGIFVGVFVASRLAVQKGLRHGR